MILHRKNINAADMPIFLAFVLMPRFRMKKYLKSVFFEPKKNHIDIYIYHRNRIKNSQKYLIFGRVKWDDPLVLNALYLNRAEKALSPCLRSRSEIALYCTATSGREPRERGFVPGIRGEPLQTSHRGLRPLNPFPRFGNVKFATIKPACARSQHN